MTDVAWHCHIRSAANDEIFIPIYELSFLADFAVSSIYTATDNIYRN